MDREDEWGNAGCQLTIKISGKCNRDGSVGTGSQAYTPKLHLRIHMVGETDSHKVAL